MTPMVWNSIPRMMTGAKNTITQIAPITLTDRISVSTPGVGMGIISPLIWKPINSVVGASYNVVSVAVKLVDSLWPGEGNALEGFACQEIVIGVPSIQRISIVGTAIE